MSFPADPDPDLPGGGGGDHCGSGESHGFFLDIHECRSGNGLFYRLILGENIEFDIHPTRVLVRHGDVRLEVRADKIVTSAPVLEHTGRLNVTGDVEVTGNVAVNGTVDATVDVKAGVEDISLVNHRHRYDGWGATGAYAGNTGKPTAS